MGEEEEGPHFAGQCPALGAKAAKGLSDRSVTPTLSQGQGGCPGANATRFWAARSRLFLVSGTLCHWAQAAFVYNETCLQDFFPLNASETEWRGLSSRVKPFKTKPLKGPRDPWLNWVMGGVIGVAVILSVGIGLLIQGSQATTAVNTMSAVTSPVQGPLGWHEPTQGHAVAKTASTVSHFHYNTSPPTSGPHQILLPTSYVLTSQMSISLLLSLEERGSVVIAYKGIKASDLKAITAFAAKIDQKNVSMKIRAATGEAVFVTPWPTLQPGQVVLVAWTRYFPMTGWNPTLAQSFSQTFLGNSQNAQQ